MLHTCICIRPLINGKLEDKTCGDGPSLDCIFEDDSHLQQLTQDVLVRGKYIDEML